MRRSLRKRVSSENYIDSGINSEVGFVGPTDVPPELVPEVDAESMVSAVDALEAYRELLVKAKAGKGISQFSAKLLQVGVQHSCAVLGIPPALTLSNESFRDGTAVTITLEQVGEALKAAGRKVWEIIKKIYQAIIEFFSKIKKWASNTEVTLEQLKKKINALEDKGDHKVKVHAKNAVLLQEAGVPYYEKSGFAKDRIYITSMEEYIRVPNSIYTDFVTDLKLAVSSLISGDVKTKDAILAKIDVSHYASEVATRNVHLRRIRSLGDKFPILNFTKDTESINALVAGLTVEYPAIAESTPRDSEVNIGKTGLQSLVDGLEAAVEALDKIVEDTHKDFDEWNNIFKAELNGREPNADSQVEELITDVNKAVLLLARKQSDFNKTMYSYLASIISARVTFTSYLANQYAKV